VIDCATARAALWPPERPLLVGGDIGAARSHVSGCEECEAYFAQDRDLLDVYHRARGVRAPVEVRERVFDALAGARWDMRRDPRIDSGEARSLPSASTSSGATTGSKVSAVRTHLLRLGAWPLAMAAVLALVLLMDVGVVRNADAPNVFVEDYLRRAVGQDFIETNDPGEVMHFLERELGLHFTPISLVGLNLMRAEICLLEGQRGAMIVYEKDGAVVSHYVVPRDDATWRAPALSTRDGNAADMPVVTWATPNIEQALVGEVGSAQLLEIAGRGSSD
jgi:hypothetical protein